METAQEGLQLGKPRRRNGTASAVSHLHEDGLLFFADTEQLRHNRRTTPKLPRSSMKKPSETLATPGHSCMTVYLKPSFPSENASFSCLLLSSKRILMKPCAKTVQLQISIISNFYYNCLVLPED